MTDKLSSSELMDKTFVYITSLTRECRKALTLKFEREHKGIPLDSAEATLRQEVESWFTSRDRNIKLSCSQSMTGKLGEILITYSGVTKDVRFKIHVNGLFKQVDSSDKALSYFKSLNFNLDKREFIK